MYKEPKFVSDYTKYHTTSSDPLIPGCRATLLEEDGVLFTTVEPMLGTDMYLGRTVLIEAAALLFDLTPDQVVAKLSPRKKAIK